jgi:uncharacterized membrane protein YfcA
VTGLVLFYAAALGCALNAVVGGGSFVAFPALLFAGVPAVSANATTAFALWPGALASIIAYRRELKQPPARLWWFGAASVAGGALGALLLMRTPNTTFVRIIPWLMLFATVAFTFGRALTRRLGLLGKGGASDGMGALVVGAAAQLFISIYGGYFGGGMGIVMLATWSLLGMSDLNAMNGLRTLLSALINGVAVAWFISAGAVSWRPGLVMVAGATCAGYGGAALARRIDPEWVRRFVMAVAWAMTGYFFATA